MRKAWERDKGERERDEFDSYLPRMEGSSEGGAAEVTEAKHLRRNEQIIVEEN